MTPNNPNTSVPKLGLIQLSTNKESSSRCRSIAQQLQEVGIACTISTSNDSHSMLAILIEGKTPDSAIAEALADRTPTGVHIILLYDGEKPLPFYKIWHFLNAGADEVLSIRNKFPFAQVIKAKIQRWKVIDRFLNSDRIRQELIGSTAIWQKTLRQVLEVACFSTLPVLILGESGTGKELVARLIHDFDKRPGKQDIVLLDCTTIVPELSGSEFFGHEKGAFTNAISTRDGAFALADRGTLFLDEIGDLPLRLQAELLRVIQEGIYKRVGSNTWKRTKFRLISATHRHLFEEVQKGNFRQDLYYRICTCIIKLPSLRDRRLDIPELAKHFLQKELKADAVPKFSAQLMSYLMSQEFPGNVRELKQLIARLAFRYCGDGPITLGHIPFFDRQEFTPIFEDWQEGELNQAIRKALGEGIGLKDIKRITGEIAMDIAIQEAAGNLQEAARRLGVSDRLVQGYLSTKRNQE